MRRLVDLSQEGGLDVDVWATAACDWPDKDRPSNGKEERRRKHPRPSVPGARLHLRSVSARKSRLSAPESKAQSYSYLSMLDGRVLIATARVTQAIPVPAFLAAEAKLVPLRRVRKTLQSSYAPYSLVKQNEERVKAAHTPSQLPRSVVLPGLHEGVYRFPWAQRKPEDKENKAYESGFGLQIKSRFARRPHSIAM